MKHKPQRAWSMPKGYENEPDYVKGWILGMPYRIQRHPEMGHLCGYIRLPKDHPWMKDAAKKKPTRTLRGKYRFDAKGYFARGISSINVHGDVTYYGGLRRGNGLWIGFDCAHYMDFVPGQRHHFENTEYRDVAYVKKELESIAEQAVRALTTAVRALTTAETVACVSTE